MPKAYDEQEIKKLRHGVEVFTHQMPTSAQRREALKQLLDSGLPLGAQHVPTIKPGVFIAGTLVPPDDYAYTTPKKDRDNGR